SGRIGLAGEASYRVHCARHNLRLSQQISCISYFGIHDSSSQSLQDPPREFPLYIVCRIPHSAKKHLESSIRSSACKPALYSLNRLYSDLPYSSPVASPKNLLLS